MNRFFRSKTKYSKELDKNSLRWLWIIIFIAIISGIVISKNWDIPIANSRLPIYLGLSGIIMGMIIRFTAIRTLGKFFTVDLTVHKDQRVIQNGLYRYVRHPSYSGGLLSFLGFGLVLNNWVAMAVVFIPVLAAFIHRINIEEQMLLKNTGNDYAEYKKHTKKLIPFFY